METKPTKYLSRWKLVIFYVLFFSFLPTLAFPENKYVFERMWPTLQQPWYFFPADLAEDDKGNIYVSNMADCELVKLTVDGQVITVWKNGIPNPTIEQWWPTGVAVGPDGFIYVVDVYNACIQKFTPNGQYVSHWGTKGTGSGQFQFMDGIEDATGKGWNVATVMGGGIAVDQAGYVYVTDTVNNRIQKFTADGTFVVKWGVLGTGDGQFDRPIAIEVDKNGNVYVIDTFNNRVQKFDSDGTFIKKWGSYGRWGYYGYYDPELGTFDGQFFLDNVADGGSDDHVVWGNGITVDADGNVYVVDVFNYRIQKFTTDGQYLTQWGSWGKDAGKLSYPTGIAISKNGYIYIAELNNKRIQKLAPDFRYVTKWGSTGTETDRFHDSNGITVDGNGIVYVSDFNNWRVQKFTSEGQYISSLSLGEYWGPVGVVTDGSNNLYVAANSNFEIDMEDSRIYKFDSNGDLVTQFGSRGTGNGEFHFNWGWGAGMAFDSNNNFYIVDTWNNRIQKWTPTEDGGYNFDTAWGGYGSANGQFIFQNNSSAQIAVDNAQGLMYVADPGNWRVQKFDLNGTFLGLLEHDTWTEGEGQPHAISVDGSGNIFVGTQNLIIRFDANGTYIDTFSERGATPGLLDNPYAMDFGPNGKLYVADTFNNRVQVFKPVSQANSSKAIIVAGGGPFPGNNLWDATQMSANFAFRTLTYQGFTKENIFYLTSDTDLDLDSNGVLDDVDGDVTNANLQNAITNWAADADSLVVYIVDHGGNTTFRMSGTETLSATDLDTWLDQLQATMPGRVTVIYDACESGSFLSALTPPSGKERIVITSTSPGEGAYFVTQGSVSFSNYFWTHIFNGVNVKDGFELSRNALSNTTAYQHPQLDADGDGVANEEDDLALAEIIWIGNGAMIQGDAPDIESVSADPASISGANSSKLSAITVTDDDGIARVWAVIRPPDYNQGSAGNPVNDLPSIDLMPVGGDGYEATYDRFNLEGTYQIAIYARDRIGNTCIPKLTTVAVENPLSRKAIMIVGGSQSDELWPAMEKSADLTYAALKFQGYTDNDIYFMSPVTLSTGVDVLNTLSNLSFALNTWASQNTQDVVLYMVGNGGNCTFQINSAEILTALDLDNWLDNLQTNIPGKVTVIYDASQSGSFIPLLGPPSGKERIMLCSASGDQPAHFISGGDISFSRFFWGRILNGINLRDAFLHAKSAISYCQRQTPQLDDNSNGISNEKSDGNVARYYTLGTGIILAGDDPLIGSVSPEQSLSGESSVTIWAEDVTTTGTIQKVWAVITPPNYSKGPPGDPVIDLPGIDLVYNANTDRYEAIYGDIGTCGMYEITVYAMDTQGNISMPMVTRFFQAVGLPLISDVNGDCIIDLADVIVALQVLSAIEPVSNVSIGADVNNNGKIGLEEVIYALQEVSGLR